MCKRLACGLTMALVAAGLAVGQDFVDDQIYLLEPGLTMEVFQDLGDNACHVSASIIDGTGWGSFVCDPWVLNGLGAGQPGGAVDAVGNFYQIRLRNPTPQDTGSPKCYVNYVHEIERRTPTGSAVIAEIPSKKRIGPSDGSCSGEYLCTPDNDMFQDTLVTSLAVDSTNGYLFLAVNSYRACQGSGGIDSNTSIIRISGLPTIHDIIPEGPPGPPGDSGPPGPQGPPGLPADESRVLALEQQVATLQGQAASQQALIETLQTTLEQIESLPTIQRLLEKVQELEAAGQ